MRSMVEGWSARDVVGSSAILGPRGSYPSTTLRAVPLPSGYAAGEADSPVTLPTVSICGSTSAGLPGAYHR